jgi:hypothetical protein
MSNKFRDAMLDRFQHGWNTLPGHMRAAGLTSVITDVAASGRVPETRKTMTKSILTLVFTWARAMTEREAPGSFTISQLDTLEKEVSDEI